MLILLLGEWPLKKEFYRLWREGYERELEEKPQGAKAKICRLRVGELVKALRKAA